MKVEAHFVVFASLTPPNKYWCEGPEFARECESKEEAEEWAKALDHAYGLGRRHVSEQLAVNIASHVREIIKGIAATPSEDVEGG